MKKTLSVILVAVMLLSALVSLVVPAAAAEEGNWEVYLPATAANSKEPEKNPPLPGYEYDARGFHSISPNYTNYNPKFTVTSKDMYNITNFTMTVVIHDYCVTGDNWLSFSLWSESNGIAQGDTSGKYGDGWTSLIRPGTDGNLNRFESWNQTIGGRSGKQSFTNIDGTQNAPVVFEPDVDPTGDITITFAITNGVVTVNGMTVGAGTDKLISERFKEGLAYVAVTLHNTDATGTYAPTISITDVNGEVPTGSDSRAPESKVREIAPIAPSDSVPANTPAIWFDGTLEYTNTGLPKASNCEVTYADDNASFKVTAEASALNLQFDVPDSISYEAADFTYAVVIFKNFCTCSLEEGEDLNDACGGTETGLIRYCAGNVTAPDGVCLQMIPNYYWVTPVDEDGMATTTDYYTVAIVPIMNTEWNGRIHALRLDIGEYNNFAIEGKNSFEIMGVGLFRSGADIVGFVDNFRGLGLNSEWIAMDHGVEVCPHFDGDEDGFCDFCGEIVEDEITEDDTTEEDTTVEDTTEEVTTKKPSEVATEAPAATEEKSGCGAMVSMSLLSLVALAGAGMVSLKKKEN